MKYDRQKDFEFVKAILVLGRDRIHQMPGVVGTGIGHSDITGIGKGHNLVVYLKSEDSSVIDQLPEKIYNIPVVYQIKGEIKTLQLNQTNISTFNSRYRPLQGGASVSTLLSYYGYGTGTIAGFPQLPSGEFVILSNNHIIAHDNPAEHTAQIGDIITQPGSTDFGGSNDSVGTLAKWVQIIPQTILPWENLNKVDCAYAKINSNIAINLTNLCGFQIKYSIPPYIGMKIKNAGKTTGCAFGTITELDVTTSVNFSHSGTPAYARFTGQINTSPNFVQKGDSGSSLISDTENAVGLIFASGSDGSATCNIMSDVENTLGVSFGVGPTVPAQTESGWPPLFLGGLTVWALYMCTRHKCVIFSPQTKYDKTNNRRRTNIK